MGFDYKVQTGSIISQGAISTDNGNFYTDGFGNVHANQGNFASAITGSLINAPGVSNVGGVTIDGGANITNIGNVLGVGAFSWGSIVAQGEGASQAVATAGTIALPTRSVLIPLTAGALATGMIMPKGTASGQHISLINEGANAITFAAAATSNVALGVGASIAANAKLTLDWDNIAQLWY